MNIVGLSLRYVTALHMDYITCESTACKIYIMGVSLSFTIPSKIFEIKGEVIM